MLRDSIPIRERRDVTPSVFREEIGEGYVPVVMRGIAADWPAVAAARDSPEAIASYILRFDRGAPADVMIGAPEIAGRFFYRDDLASFNFERAKVTLPVLVAELLRQREEGRPVALYAGAASAPDKFPGWAEANPLPIDTPDATPRVWIGNASRVSTHYDVSSNIAVVVAGSRRFALFPPEQTPNLYVGPLDVTIAGQPVSMVDVEAPDHARYPRFAAAAATMQTATLGPGDAIFIPSLWWHDVKATGPLNVLVNYWWGQNAATSPFPALIHALLSVRDLPPRERDAMKTWFEHYVFSDDAAQAADHLPAAARGVLAGVSPDRSAYVRDYLVRALNRT